jgi:transketolase
MNIGKSNLDIFAETLLHSAQKDPNILVVIGDSRGSARLTSFCDCLPRQVIELGIAEQNLVGVAAGLAASGKKVFAVSPACFLTVRSLEQIKNDVAYSNQPVRLIGISAGVSYGALGTTHHTLHDLAVLQAINNIDIVIPGDNFETRNSILSAIAYSRPIYIRFGNAPVYNLHKTDTEFKIGKAIPLSTGKDVTFIATGETVSQAVMAGALLSEKGILAGVISMHTIRPFDSQAVLEAARGTKAIITVEEHSIFGGLGSRCAQLLLQEGAQVLFKIIGIPDEYTVTGSQKEIFTHYGITPYSLANTAMQLLERERVA